VKRCNNLHKAQLQWMLRVKTKKLKTHDELACDSAHEFLAILDAVLSNSKLNNRHSILWRGVGDAHNHRLIASALRAESWPLLIDVRNIDLDQKNYGNYDLEKNSNRGFLEWASISHFYRYANAQALPLPPVPTDLHNLLVRPVDSAMAAIDMPFNNILEPGWPPRDLWPIIGLAQHYGVVTRLLDWTKSPFVAAYFSAKSGIRQLEINEKSKIAVWACNSAPLDSTSMFSPSRISGVDDPRCRVHVIDVPYTGNPNLAAQSGRFTMVSIEKDHPTLTPESPLDDVLAHIREIVGGHPAGKLMYGESEASPFVKISVPAVEAPEILRILRRMGFDASRIFPGFRGCAKAIFETVELQKQKS
jgi:hypothetical protein